MNQIPWQNISLMLFALKVREHPEWGQWEITYLAQDIEQHAIDRGSDCVQQQDVRAIETVDVRIA